MSRPATLASRGFCSTLLSGVFALLILGFGARGALAQEPGVEAQDEIPCPPGFPAIYTDPVFGTFWGYSRLTMVQEDEYHTYKFYTYEFSGKTNAGTTTIKGIHHVNAAQCLDAAFAFFTGAPAVIATIHHAVFKSVSACDDREAGGGGEYASVCDDGGGGGAGNADGGGTSHCWTLTIDHYWYYPDTGRIEYRYSESHTWCEQAS